MGENAKASSALAIFKPLMTFALRFNEEKVLLNSKIESLRLTDNMYRYLVGAKTRILHFLPKLPEKLEDLLKQCIRETF